MLCQILFYQPIFYHIYNISVNLVTNNCEIFYISQKIEKYYYHKNYHYIFI